MKRYALQVLMSAGALGLILASNHGSAQTAASKEADRATIRPFRVNVAEADLADLKRRIAGLDTIEQLDGAERIGRAAMLARLTGNDQQQQRQSVWVGNFRP